MPPAVSFVLTADDAQAAKQIDEFLRGFEGGARRVDSSLRRQQGGFRRVGLEMRKLGIGIGIYEGIAGAISVATDALREFNEEQAAGARGVQEQAPGIGKLSTVIEGVTPQERQADFRRMLADVRRTRQEVGIGQQQAADFQFTLESAGFEAERAQLAQLFRISDQPENLVQGAKGIIDAFGAGEAGTAAAVINKLQAGSRQAPVGAADIAIPVSRTAQAAGQIGTTDEELIAAVALMASPAGGAEEAGTMIRNFAVQARKKGVKEGGLFGAADFFQRMIDQGQDVTQVLPEQRAATGFGLLQQLRQDIGRISGDVARENQLTGGPRAAVPLAVSEAMRSPEFAAAQEARQAEQRQQIAQERAFGVGRLGRQAAAAVAAEEDIEEGQGPIQRYINRAIRGALTATGASEGTIRAADVSVPLEAPPFMLPFMAAKLLQYIDDAIGQRISEQVAESQPEESGREVPVRIIADETKPTGTAGVPLGLDTVNAY